MKIKIFTTMALVCCFMVCFAAIADLTGKWTGTLQTPDGNSMDVTYNFKLDGEKLTGTAQSQGVDVTIDSGKVIGNDITFSVTNTQGVLIKHIGKYYGDSISMNLDYEGMKMHTTLKRDTK